MLKQAALQTMHLTGVSAIVRGSGWRTARLAILCYHGVSLDDEHEALPQLYMTRSHLRSRLEYLRRNDYTVLSLADGLSRLFTSRLPPRSVVLTFDDGTRDFAELVVPLLREFEMPATIYLTTYYGENRWPVFNTAMRYMLWRGRDSGSDLSDIVSESSGSPVRVHSAAERAAAWSTIFQMTQRNAFTAAEKQDLLGRVARRVGVNFEEFLIKGQFTMMTPAQVMGLPEALVDVQLHTHRHRTPRDEHLFTREIIDNRASLRKLVGDRPFAHFCYPSGDYSKAFLPWLQSLGMTSATTCIPGLASAHSHPLLLPRFIDTGMISELAFGSSLAGVADLLPRQRLFRFDEDRE